MANFIGLTGGNAEFVSHLGFNAHLTHRQREVLLLLCEGLPNKLISRRLGVSDNTVKSHVASVLRSLNVSTRLEAVGLAFKLGLQRELLLRGLAEYDDSPASEHEDDDCDYRGVSYSLLGLACGPVYID